MCIGKTRATECVEMKRPATDFPSPVCRATTRVATASSLKTAELLLLGDHRNDHRTTTQTSRDPATDDAAHRLLQDVGVLAAGRSRVLEGLSDVGQYLLEDRVILSHADRADLGTREDHTRIVLDHSEDRDEALRSQGTAGLDRKSVV